MENVLGHKRHKQNNSFHMVSLWKQIKRGDGIDHVSTGEQFLQIACEGGGVAGDVGDLRGVEIQEAFDYR